jgi:hypothetical protein
VGEDALGDGSLWPTLDLGLLAQQRGRRRLVNALPFHQDATGLFDAGVMLHGKLQLGGEPLLLAGSGPFHGRHDKASEGAAGGHVLELPRLGVGAGEVECADGAVARWSVLGFSVAQVLPLASSLSCA